MKTHVVIDLVHTVLPNGDVWIRSVTTSAPCPSGCGAFGVCYCAAQEAYRRSLHDERAGRFPGITIRCGPQVNAEPLSPENAAKVFAEAVRRRVLSGSKVA